MGPTAAFSQAAPSSGANSHSHAKESNNDNGNGNLNLKSSSKKEKEKGRADGSGSEWPAASPDEAESVVDASFSVRGVKNLRVAGEWRESD
jgi:hypothetical protein